MTVSVRSARALLVVLLDARVLVVDVQRRGDPVGDDAGAVPRGGASGDAPVEDQLHVVGAAHVEVLAQHLFEEDPPLRRSVEDLGPSELRLQNRDVVADALLPVAGRERMRQPRQPLAQQRVHPRRRQGVRQPLHAVGVVAPQDAVVERLERDTPLRQLSLQILVPVDAQLGVVREVRAELQEERSEVVVHRVDVVVVHHRRRVHQPRIARAGPRVVAALGAQHPRLLLRPPDVEHALASRPRAQVLPCPLVLALPSSERHEVDPVAGGVALDRVDEPLP